MPRCQGFYWPRTLRATAMINAVVAAHARCRPRGVGGRMAACPPHLPHPGAGGSERIPWLGIGHVQRLHPREGAKTGEAAAAPGFLPAARCLWPSMAGRAPVPLPPHPAWHTPETVPQKCFSLQKPHVTPGHGPCQGASPMPHTPAVREKPVPLAFWRTGSIFQTPFQPQLSQNLQKSE